MAPSKYVNANCAELLQSAVNRGSHRGVNSYRYRQLAAIWPVDGNLTTWFFNNKGIQHPFTSACGTFFLTFSLATPLLLFFVFFHCSLRRVYTLYHIQTSVPYNFGNGNSRNLFCNWISQRLQNVTGEWFLFCHPSYYHCTCVIIVFTRAVDIFRRNSESLSGPSVSDFTSLIK